MEQWSHSWPGTDLSLMLIEMMRKELMVAIGLRVDHPLSPTGGSLGPVTHNRYLLVRVPREP